MVNISFLTQTISLTPVGMAFVCLLRTARKVSFSQSANHIFVYRCFGQHFISYSKHCSHLYGVCLVLTNSMVSQRIRFYYHLVKYAVPFCVHMRLVSEIGKQTSNYNENPLV